MDLLLPMAITTVFFALMMAGMAVGVIFSNRELKGSCGGAQTGDDCFCDSNGLPRACELGDDIPNECSDHDHAHEPRVHIIGNKIVLD